MPRTARIVINDEEAVYHVMSRTALEGFPFGDVEKDYFVDLLKRLGSIYFADVLGFCVMGNPSSFSNASQPKATLSGSRRRNCIGTSR